ncbi:hypothetical protein O3P69_009705 [Scylla paramamosain]|uniref:Uncharacterized protein n=1 Tax=Scylla paramamosain TaxID=85552 RepID=A0AAW0SGI8_SCYPA
MAVPQRLHDGSGIPSARKTGWQGGEGRGCSDTVKQVLGAARPALPPASWLPDHCPSQIKCHSYGAVVPIRIAEGQDVCLECES